MHQKNIAVIGCGHWGKNLVRNFAQLGVLKAISDPNTVVSTQLAKAFNVENLSYQQIINDAEIQAVVLAVPAPLHASMAMQAMNAGKHVYVEKPLAMNGEEAQQMIASAKINKVHLMVGHLLQYHPVFIKLREMVNQDKLGTLNYIYSNRLSLGKIRNEENIIWSFAPHDISMILSLTKQEVIKVETQSTSILQPNIADTATIHLQFEQGLKAHIFISWLHPYKEQKLVVIGEKAMAVFDDTKAWDEKLALYRHTINRSQNPPMPQKKEVEYIQIPQAEPLKQECQYFIDLIQNKVPALTDGDEGLRVLNVLTATD